MVTIVVVGAGIAGITCVESLIQLFDEAQSNYNKIILISESKLVKKVVDYQLTGRGIEAFYVEDNVMTEDLCRSLPQNLEFEHLVASVTRINSRDNSITCAIVSKRGDLIKDIHYDKLVLCHGSKPKRLKTNHNDNIQEVSERIKVIRDLNSIFDIKAKLESCNHLLVVGNGGIGLEVVHKLSSCSKTWIIRDQSIGLPFFDSGAAKFLQDNESDITQTSITEASYVANRDQSTIRLSKFGPSLGPNWSEVLGTGTNHDWKFSDIDVLYNDEIVDIRYNPHSEHPLQVLTVKGKEILCDLIISAIGVEPNKISIDCQDIATSSIDGGILIDEQMRTSISNIYAAGDVVSCDNWPASDCWFQMRLWTQARKMGLYAARSIVSHLSGDDPLIYFNFECFTHCTSFFGHRVVLLGDFNCRQHNEDAKLHQIELYARVNPGKDYVKIILKQNRLIGAVLIGNSGLEETVENLIYDRVDLSELKSSLLDNTVDIEEYFD